MKKKDTNQVEYIVDEKGSLGLLAIGYKGVLAWKKKVKEVNKKNDGKEKK